MKEACTGRRKSIKRAARMTNRFNGKSCPLFLLGEFDVSTVHQVRSGVLGHFSAFFVFSFSSPDGVIALLFRAISKRETAAAFAVLEILLYVRLRCRVELETLGIDFFLLRFSFSVLNTSNSRLLFYCLFFFWIFFNKDSSLVRFLHTL